MNKQEFFGNFNKSNDCKKLAYENLIKAMAEGESVFGWDVEEARANLKADNALNRQIAETLDFISLKYKEQEKFISEKQLV